MKVSFVAPWYGIGIPGGAEAVARRTAEHLCHARFPVEVLTTCVREFRSDWGHNHHRPGLSVENGVPVRRFPVVRRDVDAFAAVNWKLMQGLPMTSGEEQTFVRENIRSPELERFIAQELENRIFVFIPYMFGTTYWGVRACQGRAVLIPCLHDESYARMEVFRTMFSSVHHTILLSEPEALLARELYGLDESRCTILGGGVDTEWSGDEERFRRKYKIRSPFLLYAGRKDHGKNVDQLIEYFDHYRQRRGRPLELVLIGGGDTPTGVTTCEGIHDLGFVPVQDKYDAYAAATVLCQPSLQESFSLVLMEGWVARTPALVHGACTVTREHCRQSNGGLYFNTYLEFEGALDVLLTRPQLRSALGENGQRYVRENYHWDRILERYRTLLASLGMATP